MKRPEKRIFAVWMAVAVGLLAVLLSESRLKLDLGEGFTIEPVRGVMFPDDRRAQYHVWWTTPAGVRVRLTETPIVRAAVLRTNSLVVWQENRVVGRGVFESEYRNFLFAADTSGRRVELTEWLKERAEAELPGAPAESVAAVPGSGPQPEAVEGWDPRAGIKDFRPVAVRLAYWRPGITVWCTVPSGGAYRVLAMQLPAEAISACLGGMAESTTNMGGEFIEATPDRRVRGQETRVAGGRGDGMIGMDGMSGKGL